MRFAYATCGTLFLLAACTRPQKQPSQEQSTMPAKAPITDRDWELVELGAQSSPLGRGKQPATLRLESSSSRAVGFAGCNRFSASYTLAGDSLRFGPAIATKMACVDGDELERSFLGALPVVATYEATDSVLILKGPGGPLAHFHGR
jgi:heat shock protein HslJ